MGTTTERGYGSAHQAARSAAIAGYRPGQPCAECGQPMTDPATALDLAHDHANGGYKGLAHSACNRADGAIRANHGARVIVSAADRSPVCGTCGEKYHYAARSCEVCGGHYHPSGGQVRTCGRQCGAVLVRRNRIAQGWVPPEQRPKPAPKPRQPGPVASGEREPANGWPSSRLHHYLCRYCRTPGITSGRGNPRDVCPARPCQLARLTANNLRTRYGLTKEEADLRMSALVKAVVR